MALNYTNLGGGDATFQKMIQRFGVVTVMNAKVYNLPDNLKAWEGMKADEIINALEATTPICELDTLKVANVTEEGPSKTVTGGQYSNPLIKFGKSARLEMQDALGNAAAIEALCGGIREAHDAPLAEVYALHFGEDFVGPKAIIGKSFFIDQKTGQQVDVKIIFYQFLPDSIFNLTQDAEGDATVFDMNGDLLTTNIKVSTKEAGVSKVHGVFYSIVDPKLLADGGIYTLDKTGEHYTVTLATGYTGTLDGVALTAGTATTIPDNGASRLIAKKESTVIIDTVLLGKEVA